MKRTIFTLALAIACTAASWAQQARTIIVGTESNDLVLRVSSDGQLHQQYFGKKLLDKEEYSKLPDGPEAFITGGWRDYFTPALRVLHADGNPSTVLTYESHTTAKSDDGGNETVVTLTDKAYGDKVSLHYVTYDGSDVMRTYTVVKNNERGKVYLEEYASSMLHFDSDNYYLTQFNGGWANEANMTEQKLSFGKKVIDSNLGTRATMYASSFFQLALGTPAREEEGTVLTGAIGWSGNFRFTFDVDNWGNLRVVSGINPYASRYPLGRGEELRTPDFIFTLSHHGRGAASRQMHDWARKFRIKDGMGDRMTLLNNWEATYFSFDQQKLEKLMGEAKAIGVDLFLLDDGWFGVKYPRKSDTQGLGDWTETPSKLPGGIDRLTHVADSIGVKFGLWIEPEMVNPKSELFEKHPDWAITLPNRKTYYFRNQLVLDLSNPKVQDYVFSIIDGLMTKHPHIAYFKWDCNSPITNIFSHYEKEQSKLYVDYVKGLYSVLDRVSAKYPKLPMMLCSGGGGRVDYGALRHFTEFWPSDNTDPVERIFIQWGFSQAFPVKAQAAHVTTWNSSASVKFRTNVAMMGKLGFDINIDQLSPNEQKYCKKAVENYNGFKKTILDGDRYGLVPPYGTTHTATMYASRDKAQAVLFTFDLFPRYSEHNSNIKLRGLDPARKYSVKETDRMDGKDKILGTFSGDYLMNIGLPLFTGAKMNSRVVLIEGK